MRPRYINVRARSENVGSGTGGRSVPDPGPACFLADELVIRVLLPLRFVVGRTRRAGEVLRLNLLDIELSLRPRALFSEHLREVEVAIDPSQRVDASRGRSFRLL
jgi:hypothetical protein